MKKNFGACIISYNLQIAPVYNIASCTNGLQYVHSVLHRNKKDILVRTRETVQAFVKVYLKAFKKVSCHSYIMLRNV